MNSDEFSRNPKDPWRRRKSLSWIVSHWFDWVVEGLGALLANALESFEWLVHRALHHVGRLVTPWRWFNQQKSSTSDGFEDYPTEPDGWSFTESFEWFFHRLMPWRWFGRDRVEESSDAGDSPGKTTDLVETFEWTVSRGVGKLGRGLRTLFSGLIPKSIVRGAEDMHLAAASGTSSAIEKTSTFFETQRRLLWPLHQFSDGLSVLVDFFGDWWRSRSYPKLLWASPALAMTVTLCVLLCLSVRYSQAHKIRHYQAVLRDAEIANDPNEIALARTKLESLGFHLMELVKFRRAASLPQDDFEVAYAEMSQLAPTDKPGLLEAHLWICAVLLDGRVAVDAPWRLLEAHARHALALSPKNPLAARFWIEVLLHRGQLDEAITRMETNLQHFPDYHPVLAGAYETKGDPVKARFYARKAVAEFHEMKRQLQQGGGNQSANDALPVMHYVRIAGVCGLIGEDEEELAVLREAMQCYPNDGRLRATYVRALTVHLAGIDQADSTAWPLFEEICRVAPEDPILTKVIGRGILRGDQQMIETISHLQSKSLLSGYVLERIADTYTSLNNHVQALMYYQKALALDPRSSLAWNNVAWILAKSGRIDEALRAANRAIENEPDPRFHETRGQILVQMGRWNEAIEDLERALNGTIPDVSDVHRSLAVSHEALGNHEQASAHRALISQSSGVR